MIRSLLKLGLLLVAGILVYNYFFGDEVEKAQSKEVFGKVRDLGKDAWSLLKTEKAKYQDGKYDGAVDKVGNTVEGIGDLLGTLHKTAKDINDSGALERLNELQAQQRALEKELQATTPENYDAADQARVKKEIQTLLQQTEALMKDMEQQ
ncbi:MAG: hypothetical protein R2795_22315 [Saprospiraceae bacterium]